MPLTLDGGAFHSLMLLNLANRAPELRINHPAAQLYSDFGWQGLNHGYLAIRIAFQK